jgi:hypothetical protein
VGAELDAAFFPFIGLLAGFQWEEIGFVFC